MNDHLPHIKVRKPSKDAEPQLRHSFYAEFCPKTLDIHNELILLIIIIRIINYSMTKMGHGWKMTNIL